MIDISQHALMTFLEASLHVQWTRFNGRDSVMPLVIAMTCVQKNYSLPQHMALYLLTYTQYSLPVS